MTMSLNIPNFSFHSNPLQNTSLKKTKQHCIECNGEFKHLINDLDGFYLHMGYEVNKHMNTILPDEYLWEKFVKNGARNNCNGCFQFHIIDYLSTHSKSFIEKYGGDFNEWIDAHMQQEYVCRCTSFPDETYKIIST